MALSHYEIRLRLVEYDPNSIESARAVFSYVKLLFTSLLLEKRPFGDEKFDELFGILFNQMREHVKAQNPHNPEVQLFKIMAPDLRVRQKRTGGGYKKSPAVGNPLSGTVNYLRQTMSNSIDAETVRSGGLDWAKQMFDVLRNEQQFDAFMNFIMALLFFNVLVRAVFGKKSYSQMLSDIKAAFILIMQLSSAMAYFRGVRASAFQEQAYLSNRESENVMDWLANAGMWLKGAAGNFMNNGHFVILIGTNGLAFALHYLTWDKMGELRESRRRINDTVADNISALVHKTDKTAEDVQVSQLLLDYQGKQQLLTVTQDANTIQPLVQILNSVVQTFLRPASILSSSLYQPAPVDFSLSKTLEAQTQLITAPIVRNSPLVITNSNPRSIDYEESSDDEDAEVVYDYKQLQLGSENRRLFGRLRDRHADMDISDPKTPEVTKHMYNQFVEFCRKDDSFDNPDEANERKQDDKISLASERFDLDLLADGPEGDLLYVIWKEIFKQRGHGVMFRRAKRRDTVLGPRLYTRPINFSNMVSKDFKRIDKMYKPYLVWLLAFGQLYVSMA